MSDDQTPALATALGLQPHPEGGWYAETWTTPQTFHPDGYPGPRPAAGAIYFLLQPGEVSLWHTVRSDELWLWHRGGPLELLLGGDGAEPSPTPTILRVGPDIENGEHPQALVPGGVWQAARPATGREVLVSCIVAPGFDYEDFQLSNQRPGRTRSSATITVASPSEDVWRLVGGFGHINDWHPMIATCDLAPDAPTVRHLTTTDGQTIRERLLNHDPTNQTLTYEFLDSPYPVDDYRATISVKTTDSGHAQVDWWAEFTADTDPEHWSAFFTDTVFHPGLAALLTHQFHTPPADPHQLAAG